MVYLGAERFMAGYVRAVMERSGPAFKEELRAADLLLIDDVQFLAGKKGSQEELFHTLTALMSEGKPVVFACDRHPSQLGEMETRLRSHLNAGLVCGIEPYDRPLRLGILERKLVELAADVGCERAARPEVLHFLADRFVDSVRELEGGLKTLVARAGERLSQLSLDEASSFLRPHLKGAERRVTVDEIQKAACEHFRLKQADLLGERRTRAVARPRQVAMYLAKTLTTRSYPDIGRRFGNRDHTTVLHAVRQSREAQGRGSGARRRRGDVDAQAAGVRSGLAWRRRQVMALADHSRTHRSMPPGVGRPGAGAERLSRKADRTRRRGGGAAHRQPFFSLTPTIPRLDAAAAHEVHDQRDHEQNEEDQEQDLGDARGRHVDAGETQGAGDQGDDEEDQGPLQHVTPPLVSGDAPAFQLGGRNVPPGPPVPTAGQPSGAG